MGKCGLTWMMLNNFVTIVATPLKNPGRLRPSISSLYPLTSTNVPFCKDLSCVIPLGYISGTVGKNTTGVVGEEREERSSRSRGSVRGYVARSSCGANWAGLTNMERTVRSFSAILLRTSNLSDYSATCCPTVCIPRLKCPSCRAPMVAT